MYMQTTSLHIKVEDVMKKQAQQTADDLGLTLSAVVKVLLKQFIRTKQLSVGLGEEPTAYFEQLMREADEDVKAGRVITFKSPQEELAYLDKEIADEREK